MSFRARFALAAAFFASLAVVIGACGGHDGNGDGGADGGSDAIGFGDGGGCTQGSACGDGGVCVGSGQCCAAASACAADCCTAGQVCSFQKCVTPGGPCVDSTDCASNEYCDYSLGDGGAEAGPLEAGCTSGVTFETGRCLPTPPICATDAGAADAGVSCLEQCEYHGSGTFSPTLKYAWGGQVTSPFSTDVMMTPIVVELDDDNCDGKINEQDIPEILFTTFTGGAYTSNGTLHAISIVGGKVVDKWSVAGTINPAEQIAGGDIDGNTADGNEIVACGTDGLVHAFHGNGLTPFWASATPLQCQFPSIADLDGDGSPEVIVEGGILDGKTGALKATFSPPLAGSFVVSDIDGDGKLDVVTSSQGYDATGKQFVDTDVPGYWPAIGDFDKNGVPEIVGVQYTSHTVWIWHYDKNQPNKFSWVRQGIDINGTLTQHCPVGSAGYTTGGGPPTVADFNGDGTPDVALAGGIGYAVLDGAAIVDAQKTNAQTVLWTASTTDCSSAATGSAVFDFDGDGKAEVVYSDENHLRIYEGPTGNVLFSTCNTTGTLEEFPVIADVDNDGHADIVVVSNSYANGNAEYQCNDGTNISQAGVRIFGDTAGSWVRTRRVWNEHGYHITNVNEDGTIPKNELPNWTQPGLNNFRQNKQPGSEFAAPDAIVALRPQCTSPYALVATVTNIGEAALPAGVPVGFYEGVAPNGTLLGKVSTTQTLYAAQSENVVLVLASPPPGVEDGTQPLYAVVDDTATPHPAWHECRVDNDTSPPTKGSCGQVN
ncbi:MAG TPA: VCBS repeat-containing protein [Polyangiaceae bacterium]|jgi:hypothetical protein